MNNLQMADAKMVRGNGLESPTSPGWWAFEGSKWGQERLPCPEEEAHSYYEDYETGRTIYFRYIDVLQPPFQTVVYVRWSHMGETLSQRRSHGPYNGPPLLGFLWSHHPWDHALHAPDHLVGRWYKLAVPWEQREANRGHAD